MPATSRPVSIPRTIALRTSAEVLGVDFELDRLPKVRLLIDGHEARLPVFGVDMEKLLAARNPVMAKISVTIDLP